MSHLKFSERRFLVELEALSRKYGMKISGCGCCGSPSLDKLEEKELGDEAGYAYEDHIEWVAKDHWKWDDEDDPINNKVVKQ